MSANSPPGRSDAARVPAVFGAVLRPLQQFFRLEAASGIVLLAVAVIAFAWANWPGSDSYRAFVDTRLAVEVGSFVAHLTLKDLINDGLMTIFFFVVGLEIKRELACGELSTPARAALPAIAAIGGMVVPAAIYHAFTRGGPAAGGWGIPMATDIAFTIGCLALLKGRVPHALVVFVTALAIFDDIGGILVIAFFYGNGIAASGLLLVLLTVGVGLVLNRLHVRSWIPYAFVGVVLWFAMHHAGIHPTIAGVVLGMLVPARPLRPGREVLAELGAYATMLSRTPEDEELAGSEIAAIERKLEHLQSPLDRFVKGLHPVVAFAIMPLFALVNAGVDVSRLGAGALLSPVALGVGLGLLIGKQLGIFSATMLAVRLGVAPMPDRTSPWRLYGASVVAGIGFTVALFIATLAFPAAPAQLDEAKLGILAGSLLAGVFGLIVLRLAPEPGVKRTAAGRAPPRVEPHEAH